MKRERARGITVFTVTVMLTMSASWLSSPRSSEACLEYYRLFEYYYDAEHTQWAGDKEWFGCTTCQWYCTGNCDTEYWELVWEEPCFP